MSSTAKRLSSSPHLSSLPMQHFLLSATVWLSLHRPQMTWHRPHAGDRLIHADRRSPTFYSKVEQQREQHPSSWTVLHSLLYKPDLMVSPLLLLSSDRLPPPPVLKNSFARASLSLSPPSLHSYLLSWPPRLLLSSFCHNVHTAFPRHIQKMHQF